MRAIMKWEHIFSNKLDGKEFWSYIGYAATAVEAEANAWKWCPGVKKNKHYISKRKAWEL